MLGGGDGGRTVGRRVTSYTLGDLLSVCIWDTQRERERPGQSAEGPRAMRMTGITRV